MRTIVKTDEVAHLWANQAQEHASNQARNVYFEGDTIYSYGRHFPMAKMYPKKGIILMNSTSYSVSTSGHMSGVRQSVDYGKWKVIEVPNPKAELLYSHLSNVDYLIASMKEYLEMIPRARTRKSEHIRSFYSLQKDLNDYVKIFRIKSKIKSSQTKWLTFEIEGADEILEAENERVKAKNFQQLLNSLVKKREQYPKLIKWKNGADIRVALYPYAYLRLSKDGEHVETTMGATVPVREAEILFNRIDNGQDIKGWKIGHYTVISMNGELKIGCHRIIRKEIYEFANLMNWNSVLS